MKSSRGAVSENGTMDNRRWVTSWLRATPVDVKAPETVTTSDDLVRGLNFLFLCFSFWRESWLCGFVGSGFGIWDVVGLG